MEREQDDLQKQLEAQLMGDAMPINKTQPVGGRVALPERRQSLYGNSEDGTPLRANDPGVNWKADGLPMRRQSRYGNNPDGTPLVANDPGLDGPLGGLMKNTGVAGGVDRGTPQQDGGNGLDWRKTLQYGGGQGVLSGFNTSGAGYDDKAANSVKNTFGRIAQRYQANPEGLKQLVNDPDFKRAFPNAKLVGGGAGDKIDFGGVLSDFESGTPVGVVDVGGAFDPSNNTGQNWWFHPDAEDGMGGGGGGVDVASIMGGGTDVNAMINDLMNGQDSQTQKIIQEILAGQQPDSQVVP